MQLTRTLPFSGVIFTLTLMTLVPGVTLQSTNPSDSCTSTASSACIDSFRKYFARRPNDTTQDETLSTTITCSDYSSADTANTCLRPVPTGNCSALAKLLSNNDTSSKYGLLCTTTGQLMMFTFDCPPTDTSTIYQAVINMTTAFCSTTINNTLNCSHAAVSGGSVVSVDRVALLTGAQKAGGCNVTTAVKTGTTQVPMLTNPVGPDAMTAIVVLGCVFITCILAGFFFWPKCHISQAPPLPKKVMKKNGAAVGFCPVASGQQVYDGPVSVNTV